jgi:hypothetical protein
VAREVKVRFGPDLGSVLAATFLTFGAVPLALSDRRLLVVLLVPLACWWWTARARVVVRPTGLEVCNGLGVHRLPWEQVEGYDVPARGTVHVLTPTGPVPLRALPRGRAGALVQASEDVPRLAREVARERAAEPAEEHVTPSAPAPPSGR